ncbi:hypothetical protein Bbelb_390960 [Branchiostoma belcheri]|nr:hypothetical protein Bbelb_390960 [Branchiostoma belcheri]
MIPYIFTQPRPLHYRSFLHVTKNLDKLKPAIRPWIQQDTWVAIEERGVLKQIACSRNTRGNRQRLVTQAKKVKQLANRDKQLWYDEQAKEAEKAAAEGNTRVVFEKIRVLSGENKKTQMQPVKDTDGHLLTDEYSQSKKWAEHFSSVYKRPIRDNQPEIPPAESDLLINVDPFTMEEVTKAVGKLKLRKSPGEDSITAEQLKAGDTASIEWLHLICNMVLETGEVPTAWKRAVIVKLPKKGDLTICDNWRGIALLSVPGKVLSNLLLNRIKSAVDEVMREEQAGFRSGRSCIDQIFDSGELSEWFNVITGVRQGCILSPLIFGLVMDWLMRAVSGRNQGIPWSRHGQLEDLDFADDLALLSEARHKMQDKTDNLSTTGSSIGLRISKKKTKVMTLGQNEVVPLKLDGEDLQEVSQFTYLGSTACKGNNVNVEIRKRIGLGAATFAKLKRVWKDRHIKLRTKIQIYNACVVSTVRYGAETWQMTVRQEKNLDTADQRWLRTILRVRWHQHISNEEVRRRTGQPSLSTLVRRARVRWLGHVARMPRTRLPRMALNWVPQGKRRRGGQQMTWEKTVMRDLEVMGITWEGARRTAQDRRQWKAVEARIVDR